MTQLPPLETERLILRAPQLHNLDRWAETMTNPNATQYIGGAQPRSLILARFDDRDWRFAYH